MPQATPASVMAYVKRELREEQAPFFEDDDIEYYINKHRGDVEAALYELLIIKSEDSTITVSGLSTQDTSSYFKRLASLHRQFNSGILGGA